jgi:hypothetical protein
MCLDSLTQERHHAHACPDSPLACSDRLIEIALESFLAHFSHLLPILEKKRKKKKNFLFPPRVCLLTLDSSILKFLNSNPTPKMFNNFSPICHCPPSGSTSIMNRCFTSHRCPSVNRSSQLKQRPFFLRFCIASHDSFFIGGWDALDL